MSRSFERKVEKNRQKLYQQQKKKGVRPGIELGSKGEGETFKGRNVILPSLLALLGVLYLLMGLATAEAPGKKPNYTMVIIVVVLYFILAVALYLRRPYLRIYKGSLFTTKYNRDRRIDVGAISKIRWSNSAITIYPKGKGPNWIFYRRRNFFDTEAMGAKLSEFAHIHGIELEKK